jgi:hypothetical protein
MEPAADFRLNPGILSCGTWPVCNAAATTAAFTNVVDTQTAAIHLCLGVDATKSMTAGANTLATKKTIARGFRE